MSDNYHAYVIGQVWGDGPAPAPRICDVCLGEFNDEDDGAIVECVEAVGMDVCDLCPDCAKRHGPDGGIPIVYVRRPRKDLRIAKGDGADVDAWRCLRSGRVVYVPKDWNPNVPKESTIDTPLGEQLDGHGDEVES